MTGERSNEDDLQKLIAQMESDNPQLRLDREVVGKMFDYEARAVAAEARAAALQTAIEALCLEARFTIPCADPGCDDEFLAVRCIDIDEAIADAAASVGAVPETQSGSSMCCELPRSHDIHHPERAAR